MRHHACLFAVTVDCPEPVELAEFYQGFLGGEVRFFPPDFAALDHTGGVRLDFQRVSNHRPPLWPDPAAPRRVHLDFWVPDLGAAERLVLGLGALVAEYQPGGDRFRVFLDPAGHPFCLAPQSATILPD